MAIFIIDQFSLNTDLPLDIRYVPAGGRLDTDISVYKYPGMQVYDTSTQTVWYADNSLNWVEVGSALDTSVGQLTALINDLSTYVYQELDSSINSLFNITNNLESSINRIDVSLNNNTLTLQIHDSSIGDLTTRVISLESSVGYLTSWNEILESSVVRIDEDNLIQDASIEELRGRIDLNESSIIRIDSSLSQIFNEIGENDASIQDLYEWQVSQDSSIDGIRGRLDIIDGSVTYLSEWNQSQDASLDQIRVDIDTSLQLYVKKSGDTMTGPLIVDSSLLITGNSGFLGNVNIGGNLTVDGSVTYAHTTVLDISTSFINLNTGLTGTPPSWLQSGIIVERGDSSSYAIVYDETGQTFRIGIVTGTDASGTFDDSQTQAVVTREDIPTAWGIGYWNDALKRIDTDPSFIFNPSNGFVLKTDFTLTELAGAQDLMLVVGTDGVVKAIPTPDASLADIYSYIDSSLYARDISINSNINRLDIIDGSITSIENYQIIQDSSINELRGRINIIDGSIESIEGDISQIESSIARIDSSISELYDLDSQNIKDIINVGDGSAGILSNITLDGSAQLRSISGTGPITVGENGNIIEIGIDASFGADDGINIGGGDASIFAGKSGGTLQFKTLDSSIPGKFSFTDDGSTIYLDVDISTATSIVELTDTSINTSDYKTHQILEYDSSIDKWQNTNGILWDTSLATTSDDLGGVPAGTDLEGLTLKEILFKILYEYQIPNLTVSSSPSGGILEKGIAGTQYSSIDIDWDADNNSYPLAKLNNISITKSGTGTIYEASLGLVASSNGTYQDLSGITNWGGASRTINYNVYISDDQVDKPQPAVVKQESFTFYYRQFWGTVPGNTNKNQIDSDIILGLSDSRLAGETTLNSTFNNPGTGFIKYVFAYPDTVAAPDNFGLLSQILDQNDFDLTDSFDNDTVDVSIGTNPVRYRFYISKNKVDTTSFDISFLF
jgi:hypothetical protein